MRVEPEHPQARKRDRKPQNFVKRFLNRALIGHSNVENYTERWQKEFAHNPSWCDADLCIRLINDGYAEGNVYALYARVFCQQILYLMGRLVQTHPKKVIFGGLTIFFMFCLLLKEIKIETDIVKLWVSQGGRLDEELNFLSRVQQESQKVIHRSRREVDKVNREFNLTTTTTFTPAVKSAMITKKIKDAEKGKAIVPQASSPELPKENGLGGGFQVVIQTPEHENENVLNKAGLLRHVKLMEEIAQYKVEMYGDTWSLADICFKTPAPNFPPGPLSGVLSTLLEKIIPCIWITPVDCYWEGSKPLGPFPALNLGDDISSFITSLPKGNITWKNLDPTAVIKEVETLFDLGAIGNLFERAGIGKAYLDRPCIDPLDPECPSTSPNYFDKCNALTKFNQWNDKKPMDEKVVLDAEIIAQPNSTAAPPDNLLSGLIGKRKKRASTEEEKAPATPKSISTAKGDKKDDDYYTYETDYDTNKTNPASKVKNVEQQKCQMYSKSLLKWMGENKSKWSLFLNQTEMPSEPDFGKIMTGGCHGFGKTIMKWPEDLIIGGIERDKNNHLSKAEAFQSVFLVAGPHDVWLRFKNKKPEVKPGMDPVQWTRGAANDIIQAWQRNFTQKLYKHALNKKIKDTRLVHPLASTSIADMLEEFSQFNFTVIFLGYVLMLVYSGFAQYEWEGLWLSNRSTAGLGFAGVLLVTFSSVAGLGLSTWLGIEFNAATTQIVPFLTLGLGVDDMFLLLHNYNNLLKVASKNEIALLMKESGMSILITSTNNILAFLSGTILPIPALRSFCSQSGILLSFNLTCIMFIFPAMIAVDLARRKRNCRDMSLLVACLPCAQPKKATKEDEVMNRLPRQQQDVESLDVEEEEDHPVYTLRGFLHKWYIPLLQKAWVKVVILGGCVAMFLFGAYGLHNSTLGLELSDVLPATTAPAAFLRAREKYFSFYPMFAVIKGPNIDYPNKQQMIEDLRFDIAKSNFVIKQDGLPSEPYWMMMMRNWLKALQIDLNTAVAKGLIDKESGKIAANAKINDDVLIARKMICSFGNTYNCTGRIGNVKMVDEDGIILPESFYNYLTAWYNADNMMYYVSQASFFPNPPSWGISKAEKVIPPAQPLAYSQIPFYMTGLTDTPPIIEMIKEVRAVCDNYSVNGLPNFPSGIAFTFWEQYLHLSWHLFLAILTIAGCVFTVISVLIFNPWAAAMVMLIVVSMCVELAGFMGLFGVKLNPVSAVTLITAVGIGVEFTAHVVLAFLTSLGTRDERMAACLHHMFIPVMHGALSTLLGIIMLAFSEFEFVVKYFFTVMSALIIIGVINGLALLPVMLCLIGPPTEITPADGSNRLLIPPEFLNKKKTKKAAPVIPLQITESKSEESKLEMTTVDPISKRSATKGDTN
uniref:SSD domain-containing protein n=1 Tax=Rhabditophanes sp. KR3021 TaxID=114890 RepID=A0AC35U3X0_9BILA